MGLQQHKGMLAMGAVVIIGLAMAGGVVLGRMGGHGMDHGAGHTMQHGAEHDLTNMPGLRGLDATAEESAELAVMFQNFSKITREVENLPDGIRTITRSDDAELMGTVVSHVVGMIDRVDQGRDPKVMIQSPTLDLLFERRASIVTTITPDNDAIVVVQTSQDPEVVAALQTHAAEVSDMVARGMDAVHDRMAKQAGN